MNTIDIKYLRDCLKYNPESGVLTWRPRPRHHFQSSTGFNLFNSRFSGENAGWLNHSNGYLKVGINGKNYYAHRLAYAIYYGEFPEGQIDHINHNQIDNCIANLNMVSHQDNSKNRTMRNDNKSGITGVSWHKRENKWRAHICIDGCQKALGHFTDISEAAKARKQAEIKHGFHENHGVLK